MKTPFKLKSSPAKGKLGDFFKGIGGKKTDMNALRAKQARSSKGISEFQHNKTKAKTTSKVNKTKVGEFTTKQKLEGNLVVNKELMNKKVNKPKEVVKKTTPPTGKLQSQTRKDEYDAKGWAYDDTIKGYNRDASRKNFTVQTSVKPNKKGVMTPQTAQFNTQAESDAYIAKNKGSFGYKTDKDGKRIMKPSKKKQNNNKTNVATNKANSTQTKTKKKPNILASIMKPGFMHFIK
tara:strand:+ start:91 stop:795 length:705 start_codon:yes stop_codon:yes gene_type:complete